MNNMETLNRLKSRIQIQRNILDQECAEQPLFYFEAGELRVSALYEVKRAKAELELLEAKLSQDIRKNPGKYGIDKVTEGTVTSAIQANDKRTEIVNRLINLERIADSLYVLLNAYDQRRSMLKAEVDLRAMEYDSHRGSQPVSTNRTLTDSRKERIEDKLIAAARNGDED